MRRNTSFSAAVAVALLLAGCATDWGGNTQTAGSTADIIAGPAVARDGDTVEVGGRSVDPLRALGNKFEGGPPDRVDVIVTTR